MQVTIARQLGLEPTTVGNFFMNARRRSMDKWKDESDAKNGIFEVNDSFRANCNKAGGYSFCPGGSHSLELCDDDEMDLDDGSLDLDADMDPDTDDMLWHSDSPILNKGDFVDLNYHYGTSNKTGNKIDIF